GLLLRAGGALPRVRAVRPEPVPRAGRLVLLRRRPRRLLLRAAALGLSRPSPDPGRLRRRLLLHGLAAPSQLRAGRRCRLQLRGRLLQLRRAVRRLVLEVAPALHVLLRRLLPALVLW